MSEKFVRFSVSGEPDVYYGCLEGDKVQEMDGPPWFDSRMTGKAYTASEVTLQAPVEPSKIVCIGLNYHAHVEASQSASEAPEYPLIFLKPSSSVIGPGELIVHPSQSQRVDYEAELGVVIGKRAKNVSEDVAEDCIFGFTCVNDVTARDLQKKDGQWSRAKGFDTFCPVGPWIVTDLNYRDVLVEGILNGEIMQSGRTSLMIFNTPFLISYLSSVMTLNPGDLIPTGTPAGIAPMKSGDEIEVKIEGIGSLKNKMA
jgi:2-keto-4-pentenoate hydratase/2-oxohepta-3-ene-1,7-dioic acid hydratase in catechol pathway